MYCCCTTLDVCLVQCQVGVALVVSCVLCAVCSLHAGGQKQKSYVMLMKKYRTGFAWHLRGSDWSETDPVVTCQFSRF